jgi:hypothetical protein
MTAESDIAALDARVRSLETMSVKLEERMNPLLTLSGAITNLSAQLAKLEKDLSALKAQALLLGAMATVVAPILFGAVEFLLTHTFAGK